MCTKECWLLVVTFQDCFDLKKGIFKQSEFIEVNADSPWNLYLPWSVCLILELGPVRWITVWIIKWTFLFKCVSYWNVILLHWFTVRKAAGLWGSLIFGSYYKPYEVFLEVKLQELHIIFWGKKFKKSKVLINLEES